MSSIPSVPSSVICTSQSYGSWLCRMGLHCDATTWATWWAHRWTHLLPAEVDKIVSPLKGLLGATIFRNQGQDCWKTSLFQAGHELTANGQLLLSSLIVHTLLGTHRVETSGIQTTIQAISELGPYSVISMNDDYICPHTAADLDKILQTGKEQLGSLSLQACSLGLRKFFGTTPNTRPRKKARTVPAPREEPIADTIPKWSGQRLTHPVVVNWNTMRPTTQTLSATIRTIQHGGVTQIWSSTSMDSESVQQPKWEKATQYDNRFWSLMTAKKNPLELASDAIKRAQLNTPEPDSKEPVTQWPHWLLTTSFLPNRHKTQWIGVPTAFEDPSSFFPHLDLRDISCLHNGHEYVLGIMHKYTTETAPEENSPPLLEKLRQSGKPTFMLCPHSVSEEIGPVLSLNSWNKTASYPKGSRTMWHSNALSH